MKKLSIIAVFLCLAFFLLGTFTADATVFRWIKVGKMWIKVMDSGDNSESTSAKHVYTYYDDFVRSTGWCGRGWTFIAKDWTDEKGINWPHKATGAGEVGPADELQNLYVVPDKNGITIHRYFRYTPPRITVDGFSLEDKFDLEGDEPNRPDKTSSADVMVESYINTFMGVSVRMREFAWNHQDMDCFTVQDWTFYNTGNINLDDKIELPNQTLKDAYFWMTGQIHDNHCPWCVYYGEYMADSMRISYTYPARRAAATYDNIGFRSVVPEGWLNWPLYLAFSVLHADKSPKDHTDDPSQPMMSGYTRMEWPWYRVDRLTMSASALQDQYLACQESTYPFDGCPVNTSAGVWPGSKHAQDMDTRGFTFRDEGHYKQGYGNNFLACGPYTFAPKDSLRIVRAWLMAAISPDKGWEVGRKWKAGQRSWTGPYDWPPHNALHPEQMPTDADKDKDMWVFTGKDSLYRQNWAAQNAVRNNYAIPIPPPPPSLNVKSMSDKIKVEWGTESESASDFAGYRVYRAQGNPGGRLMSGQWVGTWKLVYECGKGTANPLAHSYDDITAERGQAYYYYVAAFDDGLQNGADAWGVKKSLQTGPYVNRTTRAAYLTKPAGTLSTVRVVPNPYNIAARPLQFKGEQDKIMFMGLPPECTISIYSESMDLVREIKHTNGSGDEAWGIQANEHSTSMTGQIIVSGIYFAHVETPSGESKIVKFVVVR